MTILIRTGATLAALLLLTAPAPLAGQTSFQDQRDQRDQRDPPSPFYAGGALILTHPQGDFGNYVGTGFGANGHFIVQPGATGILGIRLDAAFVNYGRETKRVPFSSTVGGRVSVDVSTNNNIILFNIGPQLMLPDGRLRPYLNANIGLSYFFTQSSVDDIGGGEPIAETTNYSDLTLSYGGGAGLYIPLRRGRSIVSLDLGARYVVNGETRYLREGSIEDGPNNTIVITPILSETNFLSFQLGVSVRLPRSADGNGWE